jgi:hypothetical protein
MNPLQEYFFRIKEPERSILLYIRQQILASDPENITETLSFGLPFFKFKKKMLCYLYFSKKHGLHYISFYHGDRINHPLLLSEGRKKFKIMLLHPDRDIPIEDIHSILNKVKAYIK